MATRDGSAKWEGTVQDGSGTVRTGSGLFYSTGDLGFRVVLAPVLTP